METTRWDDVELLASHISLLVLRAQVAGVQEAELYIISPGTQAVSAQKAASMLLELPKPVELEGRLSHDAIVVAHRSLTGTHIAHHQNDVESSVALWRSAIQERANPDTATILIRRRGNSRDALRIPFAALAVWMRDYSMNFTLGGVWSDPAGGTCGVIEVSEAPRFEGRIEMADDE